MPLQWLKEAVTARGTFEQQRAQHRDQGRLAHRGPELSSELHRLCPPSPASVSVWIHVTHCDGGCGGRGVFWEREKGT